jgi:Zn-dependent peptidase ImmA (M78 family)/transcriptional regulator with XRE-family HTH domain
MAETYQLIELARQSRGKTQKQLAELTDIPQSSISKIELGVLGIKDEHIERISIALDYPKGFFYQQHDIGPPNVHYRKRASLSPKILAMAEAMMNIYKFNIEKMLKSIELSTDSILILENDKYESPKQVAMYLRSYWRIPKGPINNLTEVLEEHGIIVIRVDFGTDKIDGRSMFASTGHPIIFVNKFLSGDRARLTIAHELGHIIMHIKSISTFDKDEESEAFIFGMEFLMPLDEVAHELRSKVNIPKLADLKKVWKISMQSILFRAAKEDFITPNQYRGLMVQFNAKGIRKKEPIEIPKETPTNVESMINLFLTDLNYSLQDLAETFNLNYNEFQEKFFDNSTPRMRIA